MSLDDYKVLLYRNQPSGWVAEVPSIPGCYALMPTRAEALAELEQVFALIETEFRDAVRRSRPTRPKSCMPSARADEFRRAASASDLNVSGKLAAMSGGVIPTVAQ